MKQLNYNFNHEKSHIPLKCPKNELNTIPIHTQKKEKKKKKRSEKNKTLLTA